MASSLFSTIGNKLKDYSIVYSFDRTGFERHARQFQAINEYNLRDKTFFITGGTSGIGEALALQLLNVNAKVIVTGRNEDKFRQSTLSDQGAEFIALDLANFEEIKNLHLPTIDGLICNAGGMPSSLHIHHNAFDTIFASQVVGHYILIKRFISSEKLQPSKPIHITSSGGMYLKKLQLDDLTWTRKPYDKVASYANAKRAQVILNKELAKQHLNYHFSCSHPGWVRTSALEEALPDFVQKIGNRLRTPAQGADSIIWALAEVTNIPSGKFWFDRKARPTTPFFWTRESYETRKALIELCESYTTLP